MKFFRWQADKLRQFFTPERMMLMGVMMVDIALLFFPYYFVSGEKFGVYWMSQLALLFAGVTCVFEARLAERQNGE